MLFRSQEHAHGPEGDLVTLSVCVQVTTGQQGSCELPLGVEEERQRGSEGEGWREGKGRESQLPG